MTGTHEDISALQEAHEARATSEAALRLLLDTMIEGVVIQDAHGVIVSGNPAAERILGLTLEQMAGRTSTDPRWRAVHEDGSDFPGEEHPAMVTIQTGQPVHDVLMGVHKVDGSLGWILINSRVIPALDDPAKVGGALTTFVDITAARESHEQLRDLASRDPLTNLLNRREMYERIDEARPGSGNDKRLGILFIDLDGLKDANDTYGHLVGDEVIIQSARRIQDSVRRDDVVARFGGDEFVVLLPSIHRAADAQRVATSIHEAVGQPIRVGEVEITITCSIGVGLLHHGEDPDSALARADAASYEAKRAGPGRTVVIDPADLRLPSAGLRGGGSCRPTLAQCRAGHPRTERWQDPIRTVGNPRSMLRSRPSRTGSATRSGSRDWPARLGRCPGCGGAMRSESARDPAHSSAIPPG